MIVLELLIIVALVLVNAVFSGAEIAVVATRKARVQQLVAEGRRGAAALLALKTNPERFFATVQVAITVVGATAGAFGGATFAEHIEPFIGKLPGLASHTESVSIAVVVVLVSYLSIVLGELVPKSLALKRAEPYALLVSRALIFLAWWARPLVWFLTISSNMVLRPFGDRTTFSEAHLSFEEVQDLVEEAGRAGSVDAHIGEIASRALDLQDITARDVMIPRSRMDAIPVGAAMEEIQQILLERGHARMPVFEGSIDNIIGYIMVKDVLGMMWERQLIVLQDLLRPAYFVPEMMLAKQLLREFQIRHIQLAIVIDEHGGVQGLVTLEDILEELVGELSSEDDHPEQLVLADQGVELVRGHAPIREVNRLLNLALPEDDRWSTLAGLCMQLAGGVPEPGARLEVEGVATLEIVEASPREIRLVRITHAEPVHAGEEVEPSADPTEE